MKRTLWVGFVLLAGCVHAPLMTGNSSGNSANSSGNSANSSGNSANSSGNSANSSNGNSMPMNNSSKSSDQSAASSAQSNQSSGNSNASSQASSEGSRNSSTGSSQQSSNNTTDKSTSAPSSQVVMGSALLTAVAGGIVLTVFTVKWRHEARMERERLRQLQFSPDGHPIPQPMPYPVQPIPAAPAQPEPDFAPFPKKADVSDIDAKVLARSWLVANELQLKQDLALGWGPTLEDLAGLSGIAPSHRAHFGKVLQRHRREFVVSAEVSPDEAARVMSRVGDLVMTDPVLRADAVVALAEW